MSTDISVVGKDFSLQVARFHASTEFLAMKESIQTAQELKGLVIDNDADYARIGDVRLTLRKGVTSLEDFLTDLFRPVGAFKTAFFKQQREAHALPANEAVKVLDEILTPYGLRREREARAAQKEADALALAAVSIAAPNELGLEGPDVPAQTVVEVPKNAVQGAVATTFIKRKPVCVLEDAAAAMQAWPKAFVFDPRLALELYEHEAMYERAKPLEKMEDGESVLLGGVRFTREASVQGKTK